MNARGLIDDVAGDQERIVKALCDMTRIKAIGPENGGSGEAERGRFLEDLVRDMGFDSVEVLYSEDPSVPGGKRPNVLVRKKGEIDRNIWVVTHMDVVPEGDLNAWTHPPFEPVVTDGKVYGRGTEDNGQDLIASVFALRAIVKNGITPECNVNLALVSDEEVGMTHGIDFLLGKGIFRPEDLIVVPDYGDPQGTVMAVVEKSIAWMRVVVTGRQTHGSTPNLGVNAFEIAARYLCETMDRLRSRFSKSDPLFEPTQSTFVPTKCEANGQNINTVPGRQEFACDFRVLPDYDLDEIMGEMRAVADKYEKSTGARIEISFADRTQSAAKTPEDSEIVVRLRDAIKAVRPIEPKAVGVGAATCANPFRREGHRAVAWSTIVGTAHDADEFCLIENLVFDTQVYAMLFAGKNVPKG
jgi:succinyl-diaminopimelate desuccinylase